MKKFEVPSLNTEECLTVLLPDNVIKICRLSISNVNAFDTMGERIKKIDTANNTIKSINIIREKIQKKIDRLSEDEKIKNGVDNNNIDLYILMSLGWIHKSSNNKRVILTKTGRLAAHSIYYMNPKRKNKLEDIMRSRVVKNIDNNITSQKNKVLKTKKYKDKGIYKKTLINLTI